MLRTPTIEDVTVSVVFRRHGRTILDSSSSPSRRRRIATLRELTQCPIEVEAQAAAIPKLALALSPANIAGATTMRDNGDGTKTPLIGAAGGTGGKGQIAFEVSRTDIPAVEQGQYQIDLEKLGAFVGDDTPPKWSATIPGSRDGKVTLPSAATDDQVSITSKAVAPNQRWFSHVTKIGAPRSWVTRDRRGDSGPSWTSAQKSDDIHRRGKTMELQSANSQPQSFLGRLAASPSRRASALPRSSCSRHPL